MVTRKQVFRQTSLNIIDGVIALVQFIMQTCHNICICHFLFSSIKGSFGILLFWAS